MKVLERHFNPQKIKRQFRLSLPVYDFWGHLTESRAMNRSLQRVAISNGSHILDVGCGTGKMLTKLVKLNPDGENVGIDLSPDMLAKAQKKLERAYVRSFRLQEGNAMQLDFPDNRFDLLTNNYMVDLLPERDFPQVAGEFYRVLKPGGRLAMTTFSFGTKNVHRFWYWVARFFPGLLTGCRPVRFKHYLDRAGFKIEHIEEVSQHTFPSQVIIARKGTDATYNRMHTRS